MLYLPEHTQQDFLKGGFHRLSSRLRMGRASARA